MELHHDKHHARMRRAPTTRWSGSPRRGTRATSARSWGWRRRWRSTCPVTAASPSPCEQLTGSARSSVISIHRIGPKGVTPSICNLRDPFGFGSTKCSRRYTRADQVAAPAAITAARSAALTARVSSREVSALTCNRWRRVSAEIGRPASTQCWRFSRTASAKRPRSASAICGYSGVSPN
jgi:hypothetical protein